MDSTTQQKSAARPARPALPFADRIIRPTQAAQMLGVSVAGLCDWLAAGTFPQPRALGAGRGCVGWLESELVQFARNLPLAPGKVGSRRRKVA